ncbi:MAG TPA: hypothetical protein PK295_00140 [Candidatus Magasanikbacteria bacterium]|nr:hypothetical protein [Candidatus Magasanikbacteria bacterium]
MREDKRMKKIVLIEQRYPYGKDKVYLSGSIVSVAARLLIMGHEVQLVDLNIDRMHQTHVRKKLREADLIGVAVVGAPAIPGLLRLIPQIRAFAQDTLILVGGQVIERVTTDQFNRIFGTYSAVTQIKDNYDLAQALDCKVLDLPPPEAVSYVPVWKQMGEERMVRYLEHESVLVISQGCHFRCDFCAASKQMKESFRSVEVFVNDLRHLTQIAQRARLKKLEFYASSLDFFQNPKIVARFLEVIEQMQLDSGIEIKIRCLSCLGSFLAAREEIPNFDDLLRRAGLWCIGFGIDGDEKDWRSQKKRQNKQGDIVRCLEITRDLGITAEFLMVMGFPTQDGQKLRELVTNALQVVEEWPHVVLRPYLAKLAVPGNKGWKTRHDIVELIMSNPKLFYNLDFCALGSSLTHPDPEHRRLSNEAFLEICALATTGKCATSALQPQGEEGEAGVRAAEFNRLQPFDR